MIKSLVVDQLTLLEVDLWDISVRGVENVDSIILAVLTNRER